METKKARIIYISGGQRSGKSKHAQRIALEKSARPIYLATSRVWDEGHRDRILRHKADRSDHWKTVEEEKFLSSHDFTGKTVLLDCVTLWLTNFFFDLDSDIEQCLAVAKDEFAKLVEQDFTLIAVSNEIGMGGHPSNELQMKFTDLQGWMNQYIASLADEAVLMVSGIPVKIK